MVEIIPSILAADFAHLARDVAAVEQAGATQLHVDIMDGHFVPNLTMGPPVVAALRKATRLPFDVHFMITDPDTYAKPFIQAGANLISVHWEACRNLDRTLRHIREEGARPGVVINPATPVHLLTDVLATVDYVLIMSVNPGFGGQEFLPYTLEKVRWLDEERTKRKLSFKIEIDGGIAEKTAAEAARAGCDWLVAGSSVFNNSDPGAAFTRLQAAARAAAPVNV